MAAALGLVTNYASSTVPKWAAHAYVVWPLFGLLVAISVGLLLWGLRLNGGGPEVPLTPVDRLAATRHGSLVRPHVNGVRGRGTELNTLTRMLSRPQGRFTVVCGAGGLGKTTLAAQLAAQAEEAGQAVFWVPWRGPVDLAQQLTRAAVRCGLPETDLVSTRAGQESLPDVVWRQLERSKRWLVVIDNVDEPQSVGPDGERVAGYRGWIRPHGGGLLLVTSRDSDGQSWGASADLLRLEPLAVSAAGQVLLDLAPHAGTEEQAQALAARLGGLPLALHAVGVYLAVPTRRYRTFDRYRQALDTELSNLLGAEHPDASDPDVARTVVRHTWDVSLDQLDAEGFRLARPLLRMFALLAQAPIPLSLITPELLATATGGEATVVGMEDALAGLYRFGLLGLQDPATINELEVAYEDTAQVVLHSLVREISALSLAAETTDLARWHQALILRLITAVQDIEAAGRSGWPAARLLAPHMSVLLQRSTAETSPGALAAVESLADVLRAAGNHTLERILRQEVLDDRARILGSDHPDTLMRQNRLALALDDSGEHRQAATLQQQTLDALTRVLGPDHPDTLASRGNLAAALYSLGEYAQAVDLHRQTLSDRIRLLGRDHPESLTSGNSLATALYGMGEYGQAADLYRVGFNDRVRTLGPDHPDTLASLDNLGAALNAMGDHPQAVDLLRRSLSDRIRVLGPDHSRTAASRHNLGVALSGMGDHAQAVDLLRQALDDRIRLLGPDHPRTAASRHNLGVALSGMGDHAQAVDLLRQALDDRTRILGPNHPLTAASRQQLETVLAASPPARRRRDRQPRRGQPPTGS
ncbi:tetratricopeptide repeat protein [Streptomyces sp. NPDC000878]